MFPAIAIAICALELLFPHLYEMASVDAYYSVWQFEMVLLCVAAIFSDGSQRDRSVLTVFLLWQSWLLASDWLVDSTYAAYGSLEATAFTALVLWALARPYFFQSATRTDRTVHIAFYNGSHAPLLSSLGALFGLPFSSVAIIAGNTAIRASRCGKMVVNNANVFTERDFVFVDTGIEPGAKFFEVLAGIAGKPTKGYGIFRVKCIDNLTPLLEIMGYVPKTIFHKIPSIFYYQCIRQANG